MSEKQKNFRELESGIHTDLKGRLTYGEYLSLDTILAEPAVVAAR